MGFPSACGAQTSRPAVSIPTGVRLTLGLALSVAACGTAGPIRLLGVSAADLLLAFLCRVGVADGRRLAKLFTWQSLTIVLLYLLRFRSASALLPGLQTSWQLFLALVPGIVLLQTTPPAALARTLSRLLPASAAFVLATCLNFLPVLVAEARSIYEVQLLRGARILPRDLLRPRNWPDLIHCLLVPMLVQGITLSEQIALAARARQFDLHGRRTCWPGE